MSKLTGKTRCRIEQRLFKQPLLVLQVEVEGVPNCHCTGPECCQVCHPSYAGGAIKQSKWFVDATLEHLNLMVLADG